MQEGEGDVLLVLVPPPPGEREGEDERKKKHCNFYKFQPPPQSFPRARYQHIAATSLAASRALSNLSGGPRGGGLGEAATENEKATGAAARRPLFPAAPPSSSLSLRRAAAHRNVASALRWWNGDVAIETERTRRRFSRSPSSSRSFPSTSSPPPPPSEEEEESTKARERSSRDSTAFSQVDVEASSRIQSAFRPPKSGGGREGSIRSSEARPAIAAASERGPRCPLPGCPPENTSLARVPPPPSLSSPSSLSLLARSHSRTALRTLCSRAAEGVPSRART